jgi:hypothetical protein
MNLTWQLLKSWFRAVSQQNMQMGAFAWWGISGYNGTVIAALFDGVKGFIPLGMRSKAVDEDGSCRVMVE